LNTASNVAGNIGAFAGSAGVALPSQVTTALNVVSGAGAVASALTGSAGTSKDVLGAIGKGISAAKLSDSLGGLGGIANSLKALEEANDALDGLLDSVKGISGSAFSAIKDSFGKLEANKPQNLAEIAKERAAKTAVTENTPGTQPAFAKSLSSLVTKAGDAFNTASKLSNDLSNSINSLTGPNKKSLASAAGAAGAVTGAGGLAGAVGSVNSTIGSATDVVGGVSNLTNAINDVTGAPSTSIISAATSAVGSTNITTTLSTIAEGPDGLPTLPNTINVGTINNAVVNDTDQLTSVAGGASTIVNNIANTGNNLDSASQQVTTLINSTTGADVDNLAKSISGAVDNVNSLAGASTSLKNGLSGLANAAKKTQGGGIAARAAQLSSGVSNLPGGIKAFSSVLDKADDLANKIPGTGELTGLMKDSQTDAINLGKVSSTLSSASTTLGQAGDVLNAANKVVGSLGGPTTGLGNLSSIASKAGGLTSSISSKLSIGDATQLLSSVSALGAGGASPIKLPSLGVNTTDRTSITAQIKGVLGDARIPVPNLLGDILGDAIDSIEQRARTLREERRRIQAQLDTAKEEETAAGNAFIDAFNTLPAGDPSIAALEKKFNDATAKTQGLIRELANVGKRPRKAAPATDPAAAGTPPPTTGTTT